MALPNGPMEIVISFDTTSSMYRCLDEVRSRVSDMVQRLQADIPGIKIAIFAHGDYCDSHIYVTKYVDFTDNVAELCDFIKNVEKTDGGDLDECYELVLYEVRTKLSWTPGSQRALVMIGDAQPHEPGYLRNTMKLNWRHEADALCDSGVKIYAAQCRNRYGSADFYADIARRTNGHYLRLEDFKNIFDFLMAVCYREKGTDFLENYEKEVRARRGPVNKDLNDLFGGLRDPIDAASPSTSILPAVAKATVGMKRKIAIKASLTMDTKQVKKNSLGKPLGNLNNLKPLEKFKLESLPRLHRENVPQTNFILSEMSWSKWHLAISPDENDVTTRARGGCGYRARKIFNGQTNIPALYEVAVQNKAGGKKFVVFSKCSSRGFECGKNWESRLFSKDSVRSQVNEVVKNGCKVFMRRTILGGKRFDTKVKDSISRYSYAWNSNREVIKGSLNISSNMEVDA